MNSVFCLETREKIGQDMGFGEARQGGVLQGFSQHSNFFQSSLQSPSEKKDIYEPLYCTRIAAGESPGVRDCFSLANFECRTFADR